MCLLDKSTVLHGWFRSDNKTQPDSPGTLLDRRRRSKSLPDILCKKTARFRLGTCPSSRSASPASQLDTDTPFRRVALSWPRHRRLNHRLTLPHSSSPRDNSSIHFLLKCLATGSSLQYRKCTQRGTPDSNRGWKLPGSQNRFLSGKLSELKIRQGSNTQSCTRFKFLSPILKGNSTPQRSGLK